MVFNDIWGTVRIEKKYENVINSKEFQDLKNKIQLGLNTNPNAIHTRYQHSIGVYNLACKLVEICKNKFSEILNITKEDEEAIKCMGLVHDIGHGPFSHVSEKFLKGTHEERSVEILLDPKSEVHKVIIETFGENILEKIVQLIQMKKRIKDKEELDDDSLLFLIVSKLLSGGIDIDRLDYIYRDSKFVLGETNDFTSILEHIDLEYIDDKLEIVFDESAEYLIANFFNKRFELYDTLYYSAQTKIIEKTLEKLLNKTKKEITWSSSETELNNFIVECLSSKDEIVRRYAEILVSKKIDNFSIKETNNIREFELFKERVFNNIPELSNYMDAIYFSQTKIDVYNKEKDKILIRKNGIISDISECSKILNSNLVKEKHVIGIDLNLLKLLLRRDNSNEKEVKNIISRIETLFNGEIEQEKKYTFIEEANVDLKEGFKLVANALGLENPEYIENHDIYYDSDDVLSIKRIAVRKRIVNGKEEWNIKRPLNDITSISKRNEITCNTKEEVLRFLEEEWEIKLKDLEEVVTLKTKRAKYKLKYKGGIYEVCFDKTIPHKDGEKYKIEYMIECELKSGKSAGLYFVNQIIKKFIFLKECNQSKKELTYEKINRIKIEKRRKKLANMKKIILNMKNEYTVSDLINKFEEYGIKDVTYYNTINLLSEYIESGMVRYYGNKFKNLY